MRGQLRVIRWFERAPATSALAPDGKFLRPMSSACRQHGRCQERWRGSCGREKRCRSETENFFGRFLRLNPTPIVHSGIEPERRLLASAAIRLASTAKPSPPTRLAALQAATTRSNICRKKSPSRNRSLRARENAEPGVYFFACCMVSLGTMFSSFWILANNSLDAGAGRPRDRRRQDHPGGLARRSCSGR